MRAEGLKGDQPPPGAFVRLWTSDVDLIAEVPGHGVLVGTTIADRRFEGTLSYGPLVMLDEGITSIRWQYGRSSDYSTKWEVLSTDPVILLRCRSGATGTLVALDPDSGSEVWVKDSGANDVFARDFGDSVLFWLTCQQGQDTVCSLDLRTGTEQWRLGLGKAAGTNSTPQLVADPENLFVISSEVVCLSPTDGQRRWSVSDVGPVHSASYALQTHAELVVPGPNGALTCLDKRGQKRWSIGVGPGVSILSNDKQRLYVHYSINDRPSDRLECFELAKGRRLWSRSVNGRVASQLLLHEGYLVFVVRMGEEGEILAIWDPSAGTARYETPIPSTLDEGEESLADYLAPYPGTVVVARERGVGAFRLSDGKALWYHALRPKRYTVADVLRSSKVIYQNLGLLDSSPAPGQTPSPAFQVSSLDKSVTGPLDAALRHQSWVYQRTERVLHSSSSTRSEIQSALGQRIAATNVAIGAASAQFAMERRQAWMNLAGGITALGLNIAEANRRALITGNIMRCDVRVRAAEYLHQNHAQDPYYVRPFHTEDVGDGILLVDMRKGSWREFMLGPTDQTSSWNLLGVPFPIITTTGDKLLVNGIGLDSAGWQPTYSCLSEIIPAQSIFSYDLKSIPLYPASEYASAHQFGYIDTVGRTIIPPLFESASEFHEGLAGAKANEHWGFINRKGQWVIPAQFDDLMQFSEGRAFVKKGNLWHVVDTHGRSLDSVKYTGVRTFSEGRGAVQVNGKWGFIDISGRMIVAPAYDDAGVFQFGKAHVARNGKHGFIDREGRVVVPLEFDGARDFSEGLAGVKVEDQWGFIDTTGAMVIEPDFREVLDFHDGLAPFKTTEMTWLRLVWRFMDRTGSTAISDNYRFVTPFTNGLALVELDHQWGYVRPDGTMAIPISLHTGEPFLDIGYVHSYCVHDGRIRSAVRGLFGYMDATGNFVIQPRFVEADHFSEGLAAVRFKKER